MGSLTASRTVEEFCELKGRAWAYKSIIDFMYVLETPQELSEEE
jgi:hypothetical protein